MTQRREQQRELISARELAVRGQADDDLLSDARRTAAARLELARANHHLRRTRSGRQFLNLPTTKVKGISMRHTDTPSELAEQSDGVSDDGAFDDEIIGACACDGVGSGLRQHLSMGSGVAGSLQHLSIAGSLQHLTVGGLGDLAVAGLPSYLFTRKNLSNPAFRQRLSARIQSLTPKLRRRVLARLRSAVSVARSNVGVARNIYPTVGHGGWSGITVSGGRRGGCPYANVAGALTP